MDLQDKLAMLAKKNASQLSTKQASSDEAVVVGYDVTTGKHIVKRDGTKELADSATSGILKLGVIAPTLQGQVFAMPSIPKKKIMLSAPQRSSEVSHKVFFAEIPGEFYYDGPYKTKPSLDIGVSRDTQNFYYYQLPPRDGHYYRKGNAPMSRKNNPSYLYEGMLLGEGNPGGQVLGYAYKRAETSHAYKILKAVIDGIYPVKEGDQLTSDRYLSIELASGGYGETLIRLDDAIEPRRITALTPHFTIPASGIIVLTGYPQPFYLKRLLHAAFKDKLDRKILILSIGGSGFYTDSLGDRSTFESPSLNISWGPGIGMYKHYDDPAYLVPNFYGYVEPWTKWNNLRDSQVDRMLGFCPHGYYIARDFPNIALNTTTLGGRTGGATYEVRTRYDIPVPRPSSLFYAVKKDIPFDVVPPRDTKEFSLLRNNISSFPSQLYVGSNGYFSGICKKDPIQIIYGEAETPHYFIKGISEEYVTAVDVVAEANNAGISKADQYYAGFDKPP